MLDGIAARAAGHDADGSFPFEAFDALSRERVLSLTVPADVGGGGGVLADAAQAVRAVGWADPSVALVLSQHLGFHHNMNPDANPAAAPDGPAGAAWPADLLRRVRQSSIDGVALVNALRVERDLGTPGRGGLPAAVASRLPNGAGWRLSGRKIYSTGIPMLRWLLVWARTDDDDPLVGTFVVDAECSNHRVERTWDSLGMRATRSDDVIFDGVEIPLDHAVALAPASSGPGAVDPVVQATNAILISAVYQGVARAARDWLVRYLNERTPTNLGAPLASLPRFQEAFGRIEAIVATGDRLLMSSAQEIDAAPGAAEPAAHAQLVKYEVTNGAVDAVLTGVRLIGNPGLLRTSPLERHLRNVLHGPVHSPQDDTILVGAGRAALRAAAVTEVHG
ncbi:MAG: Acyl-CoA dehydrogenase type 2 domain protein [Ilumatobacteraceae bacterium]|nr:Acyl-CoA dehydrogenase type 2 domain protein [Ilumatobacteraceae bacterium]